MNDVGVGPGEHSNRDSDSGGPGFATLKYRAVF